MPPHGGLCLEVRNVVAILHNGLAIDNCRLAAKADSGADDGGIAVAPIKSVARQHTRFAALKQYLAAISVILNFVNPVLALWRLIDRRRKLGLNEFEPFSYK
jgi:hypothetical protein